MAEHCAKKLRKVDLVLCSPAIRAHETLRLLEQYMPPSCKVVLDESLYLAGGRRLLSTLREVGDDFDVVLVVGHEPGLSDLAAALAEDEGNRRARKRVARGLKTASLARVDLAVERWKDLRAGSGRLREVIQPNDLG